MGGSAPSTPDPNASAIAGQQAALANYPFEAQINALAQEGGKGVINGQTYDFSGLSPAQVSGGISQQMAQSLLNIQQANDPAMIQQELANLNQADPAGFAAYGQLFDQIMQSAQNPTDPNQPLSGQLQTQIQTLLNQGPNLTTGPNSQTENIQNQVRGQEVQQGIYLGNAPAFQEAAALDTAGQQQQTQNQAEAASFSQSGVSPQDVQFRQIQQALSNLGAFQNGQTPTAEFSSLSGAQQGVTPFTTYGPNQAQPNLNAGLQGEQNALSQYAGNINYANNQANPFLTGVSGAVQGLGLSSALQGSGIFGASAIPNSQATAMGLNDPGNYSAATFSAPTPYPAYNPSATVAPTTLSGGSSIDTGALWTPSAG